jgi:aspartate racemase
MADVIAAALSIPLLHIADAAAAEIRKQGLQTVGLLGTRFTMEQDFYRNHLEKRHGLKILIPGEEDRKIVHDIIYQELGRGIISETSREVYKSVIRNLDENGAEGVILGCTEIPLLIRPEDYPIPMFDTTALHAAAAVALALE